MNSPAPDPENVRVGGLIRDLRKAKRLTQEDLARSAGIRVRTVQYAETGQVAPRLKTRKLVAAALGVPVEYFEAAS